MTNAEKRLRRWAESELRRFPIERRTESTYGPNLALEVLASLAEAREAVVERDDLLWGWHQTHGYKDARSMKDSFTDCTWNICARYRVLLARDKEQQAVREQQLSTVCETCGDMGRESTAESEDGWTTWRWPKSPFVCPVCTGSGQVDNGFYQDG